MGNEDCYSHLAEPKGRMLYGQVSRRSLSGIRYHVAIHWRIEEGAARMSEEKRFRVTKGQARFIRVWHMVQAFAWGYFALALFIDEPRPQSLLPGIGLLAFGFLALRGGQGTDDDPIVIGNPLIELLLFVIPIGVGTAALLGLA